MTKTEMTTLLRIVGVNENTITAMENAYELGVEAAKEGLIETIRDLTPRSGHQTPEYLFSKKIINSLCSETEELDVYTLAMSRQKRGEA